MPLVIDVVDRQFRGEGARLGALTYEELLAEGDERSEPWYPADEWQAIGLNYTSGTTGQPKGVVVHHRGTPRNGADVRVTLLQWLDPKPSNRARINKTSTWFTDPVPWTAAVNEVLNSAAGTTAQPLGPGWSFVGTTDATRRQSPTGTLDNTRAGVVTFDLDTSALEHNRVILLVAVVRAGGNIALGPLTLQEMALTRHEVAVRSMHVTQF